MSASPTENKQQKTSGIITVMIKTNTSTITKAKTLANYDN